MAAETEKVKAETTKAHAETERARAEAKLAKALTKQADGVAVMDEWEEACFPDEGFLAGVPEGSRRSYRVCVDATNGPHVIHVPTRPWPNLLPHHRLVVLVKHRRDDVVTAQVNGTAGIYIPGTDNSASLGVKSLDGGTVVSSSTEAGDRYTRYVFPKYLPGEITLTVEVEPKPVETVPWSQGIGALVDARGDLVAAENAALRNKASAIGVSDFTTAIDATKDAIDAVLAAARAFTPSSAQGEAWVVARLTELGHVKGRVVTISESLSTAFPPPQYTPDGKVIPPTPEAEERMRPALDRATNDLAAVTLEANALAAALGAHKVPGAMTHKLSVEPTYTGSLRLGVAAPVFGASDGNYRVGMPPDAADTSQLVVLDDGSSPVDLELVVGYTQYFHRRPQSAVRPRVGAFAAVGLVDLEHAEVSVLESVYVGAEFGWTNLSLGLAATVRNVTRLGNGLDVGSPVTSTDPTGYTVDRPAFGIAFVLFPTPDIWKADFSKKKGTATTTGGSSADATDDNATGSGTVTP